MAKTEKTNNSGPAIATRGFNCPGPEGKPGEVRGPEIRVEAGETLPDTVPAAVVEALIAEGSAKR
jgi:hypothetical protein